MASTVSLGSNSVNLRRVTLRLNFPPSSAVVGAHGLCTDQSLYKPAWDKCKHCAPWIACNTQFLLLSLSLYPFVGALARAAIKSLWTVQYLHKPYFKTKKMTPREIAVFIEERKWDYISFGFVAALLEGIPIIGLAFTVSNRIGAAMWAHDLEKRQHNVAELKRSGHREKENKGEKLE